MKKSFLSDIPVILGNKTGGGGENTEVKKITYDWNQQSQQDWPSFFFQNYMETLFTSPIIVAETLLNAQYQKRIEPGQEPEPIPKEYQSIEDPTPAAPLYLPRLNGDFVVTNRILSRTKYEGWTSNFKGHFPHFLYRSLYSSAQPYLEESLNDIFDVFEDHNPWTMTASQLMVGLALSPLELVRTRLIVQSLAPSRKRLNGTLHAFLEISKENENSRVGSYFNFRTMIPTMLLSTVSPLIRYFCIRIIEEQLGLSSYFNPIMYKLSQVLFLGVEAMLTCPLELAKTRIFAQTRKVVRKTPEISSNTESCIELDPVHAKGMFDCLIKVIVMEGGRSVPSKPASSKISIDEWEKIYGGCGPERTSESGFLSRLNGYSKGIASLYRAFWPRYFTLLIQFLSSEINKED